MKETPNKSNFIKILITLIFMIFFIVLITNGTKILKKPTDIYIVANGSLSYEEATEGYIIRDETVLQGENYKNGMVQILSDKERASKSEAFFRYYSNSEENILNQIAELDEEINEVIEDNNLSLMSYSDISSLDAQIEDTIDLMYNVNYLQKNQENKNKIEAYISKKAQITGVASPSDSYVRILTDKRMALENELEAGAEIVVAPKSGLASYRVDGLEEILKMDNFDYLSKELLDSFELKVGATIPLSTEKGKIVDNFEAYIAVVMNTERSMSAKIGDKVYLRLSNSDEIEAEISYIKDEEKDRVIVFKITDKIDELLEYRKISIDVIWWKYSGLKVSNSALIEDDDKIYVEKNRANYTEKILVKVLRQNDTYSIVENYDEEELKQLGYSDEEISEGKSINLYDEVVLH